MNSRDTSRNCGKHEKRGGETRRSSAGRGRLISAPVVNAVGAEENQASG